MHYSKETPSCSTFRVITTNFLGVRIFRKFTVSQFIRLVRASSHVSDFNRRKKDLTAILLKKAIVIINFIRRFQSCIVHTVDSGLVEKYKVSLKKTSATRYIGTRIILWRLRKIVGKSNLSEQFKTLIKE